MPETSGHELATIQEKVSTVEAELRSIAFRMGVLIWVFGVGSTVATIVICAAIPWAMSVEASMSSVMTRLNNWQEQGPQWLIDRVNDNTTSIRQTQQILRELERVNNNHTRDTP